VEKDLENEIEEIGDWVDGTGQQIRRRQGGGEGLWKKERGKSLAVVAAEQYYLSSLFGALFLSRFSTCAFITSGSLSLQRKRKPR
jgi:hypothetical protein